MKRILVRLVTSLLAVTADARADAVGRFPDIDPAHAPVPANSAVPAAAEPAAPAPRPSAPTEPPATRRGLASRGSDELAARGARHEEGGRFAEAAAAYTEAVRLDPMNGEALLALGRLRVRMNDLREADDIFSAAARLSDVAARALAERARLRKGRGRDADAFRDLENAVALVPEETGWAEELAKWYVTRRAWLPALSLYRRIVIDAQGTPLEKQAALEVQALAMLAGDLDPVARGRSSDYSFVRRALARLERRARRGRGAAAAAGGEKPPNGVAITPQ